MGKGWMTEAALEIDGLSYGYGRGFALEDISFRIGKGEFTALLGPNGAGKTTLFSLITRLFEAPRGKIRVCGINLRESPDAGAGPYGRRVPAADAGPGPDRPPEPALLRLAPRHRPPRRANRIDEALDRLDMGERDKEKVRQLNGGHRRRVELARALLHRPDLLVLDEPTVGLDVPARRSIVEHVHELCRSQGMAVLWATHLIDEVHTDDRVVVIHKGRILADGSVGGGQPEQFVRQPDADLPPADQSGGGMNALHYGRALNGIVTREVLRFLHQRERFLAALVRPLVWLLVFAAGFRAALGISIIPPYETYITYETYIIPGLVGMIQLFNGMQSSLSMVYDREMGSMRTLLVSPLPALVPADVQAAGGRQPCRSSRSMRSWS